MQAFAVVVAAAALLAIVVRPFRINEAWWACGAALILVATGALDLGHARFALARSRDVCLFLIGMMALAEFARVEGVFAWIASKALRAARGSRGRLLVLVYLAGIATTALLSNDATIVVLTPAVLTALGATDAMPQPYVYACAVVANAASTLLPIANPANLLFFADGMPPLHVWLARFGLASLAALALTYAALALAFRRDLAPPLALHDGRSRAPRTAALALLLAAAGTLVVAAARSAPLGAVALGCGAAATIVAALRRSAVPPEPTRNAAEAIVRGIAWPVVALTAALFVVVEALDRVGANALPRALFTSVAHLAPPLAQVAVAGAAALASNVANNLPVGLDLGRYAGAAHPRAPLEAAALIGVNIGPNLSTNGSLATVLWLALLRRAGVTFSPLRFLALGAVVMPPALAAAALLAR